MNATGTDVAWHGRACQGQTQSGDAAVVVEREGGILLGIVDALGHGPAAHEVARKAAGVLKTHAGPDLLALLARLHQELRGGLGAAAGACWVEPRTGTTRWAGVGNVRLRTFGSVDAQLSGRDGLLGHVVGGLREQSLRLSPGDTLLLTTDGIREHYVPEDYPGLLGDSATFVARRVIERFGRDHDDATCVVLRMLA